MADLHEYKCPSCSAPLAFDPKSGDVTCASCGSHFLVSDIIAAQADSTSSEEFNWGDYKNTLSRETMENMVTYQCQSCGAIIETDANTAATKCPYCDNNVVLTDRVSGGLKPNMLIPFKIRKEELPELVKAFYKGKRLLPKGFLDENKLGEVQGVYIPFWLFDGTVDGDMSFDATRVKTYRQGDCEVTETSRYYIERSGIMGFTRIPADASTRMDNDLMDSLEPYDMSGLVSFDGAYLSGFVANRFDSEPDAELPRAEERMKNSTRNAIEGTVSGYNTVSTRSARFSLRNPSVKYAMLPAYILNCEYRGKLYRYAVNGQTGKVVGELPISKAKTALCVLLSFLGGSFIASLIAMMLM